MKKIVETERLLVRELHEADWPDILEMNTSREVMQHIGDGKIKSEDEEQKGFHTLIRNYQKASGLGVWAVVRKKDDIFIGAASMTPVGINSEVQLGNRLKKQYWRKGYGTELAKALVMYGFTHLHLNRIMATTNLDNQASMRLLEKAGFCFEKTDLYNNWPMHYFAIHKNKEP